MKKLFLIIGIIILVIILYNIGLSVPCPIHLVTGFHCPGCGVTRCLASILKLDFYQAFRYNPLIFIMMPFLLYYAFYKLYVWCFDKKDMITSKLTGFPMYMIIAVLIVYGIMRNISMFSFLAPTEIH